MFLFQFIGKLTLLPVVINVENFDPIKAGLIIKGLAIFIENYTDLVSSKPPDSFNYDPISNNRAS